MKIIYEATVIANAYSKRNLNSKTGVFRVAQQILENLKNKDCEIALASTDGLPALMSFLEKNDFRCVNSKKSQRKAKFLKPLFSLIPKSNFVEEGIRFAYWKSGLYSINSYQYDANELKKYDLFHSPFHPIPTKILERNSIKKLITIHDLIPKILPEYLGGSNSIRMNKTLNGIDEETFVSCVSESAKNDLLSHHPKVNPARVSVIPLAADSTIFYHEKDQSRIKNVLKKYQIDNEKPYFLLVSTLEPRKNINRTIRAFAKLIEQENLKDLQLVLVGSEGWKIGKLFDSLKANKSLKKQVVITGFVEDEDLAAIYSGALGFAYPSLYEGFGLPPLEAMQCGVPVITSDNSSLPEVVGEAGLLVNAKDEDAIAESMLKLYKNTDLRADLANKSLIQAQNFSWQKFKEDYWSLYNEILEN
ncbi:glycosyltransferase family 1 protein [Runella rosea]|uniref:Glycosyltransferase family 1 protein n=1 Tax=Runella rosea TaxID=2259595 RepID=A0A344TQN1_9BACT|nr:glycosyltransferase family 1 protein [Runella rosea]AXE20952.1 glycosyltransferase family 1 protein [Runella rosea]